MFWNHTHIYYVSAITRVVILPAETQKHRNTGIKERQESKKNEKKDAKVKKKLANNRSSFSPFVMIVASLHCATAVLRAATPSC